MHNIYNLHDKYIVIVYMKNKRKVTIEDRSGNVHIVFQTVKPTLLLINT